MACWWNRVHLGSLLTNHADLLLYVAEWLHGSLVAVALGMLTLGTGSTTSSSMGVTLTGRGVDGVAAAQEDAQREVKCRQALLSVHAFESSCHINAQVGQLLKLNSLQTPLLRPCSTGTLCQHRQSNQRCSHKSMFSLG